MHVTTTSAEMNSENIAGRLKQATVPSARLRDTENAAMPELPSHRATKSGTSRGNSMPGELLSSTGDESLPFPLPCNTVGQKCKRANSNNTDVSSDDEVGPSFGLGKGMTSV